MGAMTVTRGEIVAVLTRYLGAHPDRAADAAALAQALDREQDLASCETMPLHVSASVAAVDDAGRVLTIHHPSPERRLLPGGHVEPDDDSLYAAALRELEKTGIPATHAVPAPEPHPVPVDIQVLDIPADPCTGEPAHLHADFCFAFRAGDFRQDGPYVWRDPSDLPRPRLAQSIAAIVSQAENKP